MSLTTEESVDGSSISLVSSHTSGLPENDANDSLDAGESDDEDDDYEEGSLASSLSQQDSIDLSDGQLSGPKKLMELAQQINEFAITSLLLANNGFVDPDELQEYNDDTHCNRGILAFAHGLHGHKTITNLDLSDNNLGCKGQSGLVALAGAVSTGNLQMLDISSNHILGTKGVRYDGIKAISSAIETKSGGKLEDLRLSQNGLHASAICFLGISLVDTTLKHLDLSENAIGVDSLGRRSAAGMKSMVPGFASSDCKLVSLNLSENYLGNEECILLSSVLEVMFSLKDLDISFNDVHAVGARHLGNALKFNDTLQHLNLGGNHVQDGGCAEIADALAQNESMKSLVLAANDLTTSSCYYWIECLQSNKVLVDLNIEENENMEEGPKHDAMEWVKGNEELVMMREDPDNFDMSVRSKIIRDNLFNKVSNEDKEVISKLVSNISVKNDTEFYERVSTICPPDRKQMLRMTKNLLAMMSMTKEDKAIRLVQKAYRKMQERKREERELREKELRRRRAGRTKGKKSFGKNTKEAHLVRAGNASKGKLVNVGSKASKNIVIR
ncbi:hypothetical protein TL16_g04278 [Triparma laevis f. inornata]|uniref:Uncharacterized protein n=1 Tax=Triparma laevis f. inornata TaxID=1714386 RepID=A0A9W7E4G2_9STRA|nr:hypothetical protein TL16_g04278 [Triparma laevis f. inornata]